MRQVKGLFRNQALAAPLLLVVAGCMPLPWAGKTPTLPPTPTLQRVPSITLPVTPPAPTPTLTLDRLGLIAFSGGLQIYVMRADGSGVVQITNDPGVSEEPAWSPDGKRIAFWSTRNGTADLYVMNADGSGVRQLTHGMSIRKPSWAPDGRHIAFSGSTNRKTIDILVLDVDTLQITNVNNDPAVDATPAWSSDGGKIAFASDRDGKYQIYVMGVDGGNVRRLTYKAEVSYLPAWSPDGTKIAYNCNTPRGFAVCVVNADGSHDVPLMRWEDFETGMYPTWSPNGLRIAFSRVHGGIADIYVMNSDGSNVNQVTDFSGRGFDAAQPAWQPILSK